MSIAQDDDERLTALLSTDVTAADTQQLDATEDRLIHSIKVSVNGMPLEETTENQARIFTGNDPFPAGGNVNDHETLAIEHDVRQESDDTNGVGHADGLNGYYTFDPPFDWDEHVTLSVEDQDDISGVIVAVEYTER